MKLISTSLLANKLEIKSAYLFDKLLALGWIQIQKGKRTLTDLGVQMGGQMKNHPEHGEYIVWPENISLDNVKGKPTYLRATAIGNHFKISSQRFNLLINELGWIEKTVAGWGLTKAGRALGGKQLEHDISGGSYTIWPESILTNTALLDLFLEAPLENVNQNSSGHIQIKSELIPLMILGKDTRQNIEQRMVIMYDQKLNLLLTILFICGGLPMLMRRNYLIRKSM